MGDTSEDEKTAATKKTVAKWKGKRGALIMALHEVQGLHGYISLKDAETVSHELSIPLARIYEVLTFYNYFKLESPGRTIVSVCDGTACHIKGSAHLIDEFSSELKVEPGHSTPDHNFHLQVVRCLGCCGLAPVVVVNGKTYGKVGVNDVKKIIGEWKDKIAAGEV